MTDTMRHNRIHGKMAGAALASALMIASAVVLPRSADAQSFKVLAPADGDYGNLLLYGGSLYGANLGGRRQEGAIFRVQIATGHETVFYSFNGAPDGSSPLGGVILDSAGNFYGATYYGGSNNNGTVFKVSPGGVETQLHSFAGPDGSGPVGTLVRDPQGNLYGVTIYGGAANMGTVFKLDTTMQLTTLHVFAGPDGENPGAGLILGNGSLLGTTYGGGAHGYGAVFQVNLSTGKETVLYSFTGGAAGEGPVAGLVGDGAGNLYGTAASGGIGYGVVFQLHLATRQETVLHAFNGADGSLPESGLVRDSRGNLYGTTYEGGAFGLGTVFELDTAGNLTTLHSFASYAEGSYPIAGVVLDSGGNIYGAASGGGINYPGTIFEITP